MARTPRSAAKKHAVATLGRPRPDEPPAMRPPTPLTRTVSLRWRVTLLAASLVAIFVAITSIAAYAMVARALYGQVDAQLHARAATMTPYIEEKVPIDTERNSEYYSHDQGRRAAKGSQPRLLIEASLCASDER